jgi:hypothetical protein
MNRAWVVRTGIYLFSPLIVSLIQFNCSFAAVAEDSLPSKGSPVVSNSPKQEGEFRFMKESPQFSIAALEPFKLPDHRSVLTRQLSGFASVSVGVPEPDQLINRLVETAALRDRERDYLQVKDHYHDKMWRRVFARSRDMVQYATSYQGFETSSEAADVILDEKLKLKSKNAVELVRQKRLDAAHLQLTYAIMQLATGLGLTDPTRKKQTIQSAMREMVPLVGEDEALRSVELLTNWSNQVAVPEDAFKADPWDALTLRQKFMQMSTSTLQDDEVIQSVKSRLHHFNHISNFSRATSKAVNTTLSIAALTPTFVSPAAQGLQFVYIAATGGPEEKKVLKEVYLDRCFESRQARLNEETMLMVTSHNNAVSTHNPVLFSCTESLMQSMFTSHAIASNPPVQKAQAHHHSFGLHSKNMHQS